MTLFISAWRPSEKCFKGNLILWIFVSLIKKRFALAIFSVSNVLMGFPPIKKHVWM